MKLPVYNCLIDENPDDESGIYAISFVGEPANETDFVALNKQAREEHLSIDSHRQVLTGVVLRPNQLIYRNSAQLGEHYIRFSAAQIEKISQKMMRKHIALNNTTHQHRQPLNGNYLIELWIVEDPLNDKACALGFAGLPKGTLMCSYKIEDKEYWDTQVMSGHVRGFSLEGFFFQEEVKLHSKSNINKQTNMNKNEKSGLLGKIARFFFDIAGVQSADAAHSGTAYVVFTLADGKELYVDADGFATLAGEQMPAGEHLLADGNLLTVDADGQFTGTKEAAVKKKAPEETVAPQTLAAKLKLAEGKEAATIDAKIAELEARLAQMEQQLKDFAHKAEVEVESLKRQTPSGSPLTQTHKTSLAALAHTERMALSLATQIQRRNQ